MPWIQNLPELDMYNWPKDDNTIVISITEPGRSATLSPKFKAILRLQFDDLDSRHEASVNQALVEKLGPPMGISKEMKWFGTEHAEAIKIFVQENLGANIIVHCAAGISRSGAIVDVLGEWLKDQGYIDKGNLRYPNGHVKSLLKRHLGLINNEV